MTHHNDAGRLLESKTHSDHAGTYIDVRVKERRGGKKRKADQEAEPRRGKSKSERESRPAAAEATTERSRPADEIAGYTYFCLQKDNREQLNALEILAHETGLRLSDFSYAGIKDKRVRGTIPLVFRQIERQMGGAQRPM